MLSQVPPDMRALSTLKRIIAEEEDRKLLGLTGSRDEEGGWNARIGRATYAFHRDMTLEVFLQPFVAVGDYTNIRRLAQPSSFESVSATIPFDPDFSRKSLRGNIVLRWEYVRGSTLFVVWNMSTFNDAHPGEFSPFQDLGSVFGADGTHVFMVKMNYWLGL